jgi:hypothetical protein
MALQTYSIELKVDTTDEGHEAMTQLIQTYARDLLTSAMLLSPGRMPMIAARAADAFYDTREIELQIADNS